MEGDGGESAWVWGGVQERVLCGDTMEAIQEGMERTHHRKRRGLSAIMVVWPCRLLPSWGSSDFGLPGNNQLLRTKSRGEGGHPWNCRQTQGVEAFMVGGVGVVWVGNQRVLLSSISPPKGLGIQDLGLHGRRTFRLRSSIPSCLLRHRMKVSLSAYQGRHSRSDNYFFLSAT